uniref:Uncharacterized protein n=1 Tax=Arundo donax TaxID=35708 RepID=A0A0A9EVZ7_ARUDO
MHRKLPLQDTTAVTS